MNAAKRFFAASADSPARLLCIGCYNREMAAYAGTYFQHSRFPSSELADAEGNKHLFYLVTRMPIYCPWHHVVEEDGRLTVSDDLTVRGRFVWDYEIRSDQPLLVIDGKSVTREE